MEHLILDFLLAIAGVGHVPHCVPALKYPCHVQDCFRGVFLLLFSCHWHESVCGVEVPGGDVARKGILQDIVVAGRQHEGLLERYEEGGEVVEKVDHQHTGREAEVQGQTYLKKF